MGGFSGLLILLIIILFDELVTVQCGGDAGAFLWTTFHFIVNPILCLIYIIVTIFKAIHTRSKTRYFYPLGIAVAILYIYLSLTGSTFWLDFFNIDFNA